MIGRKAAATTGNRHRDPQHEVTSCYDDDGDIETVWPDLCVPAASSSCDRPPPTMHQKLKTSVTARAKKADSVSPFVQQTYTLVKKTKLSPVDSFLLRYGLPVARRHYWGVNPLPADLSQGGVESPNPALATTTATTAAATRSVAGSSTTSRVDESSTVSASKKKILQVVILCTDTVFMINIIVVLFLLNNIYNWFVITYKICDNRDCNLPNQVCNIHDVCHPQKCKSILIASRPDEKQKVGKYWTIMVYCLIPPNIVAPLQSIYKSATTHPPNQHLFRRTDDRVRE